MGGDRGPVLGSVRLRITAVAVLVLLVVLTVSGGALVALQRSVLTESLDESLDAEADVIEAAVADGDVGALTPGGDDDAVAQVLADDGRVVAASEELAGAPPLVDVAGDAGGGATTLDGVPGEDEAHRAVVREVDGTVAGDVVVVVASPLDDIEESTAVLVGSLAVGVPLVCAVLAVLVWLLVGRTLRPVEAIRSEVAAIGGHDLHRRVTVPPTGDEVAALAGTMNAMLDRVERAAELQRRFVADASHELRTPLTRMRSELEVDLAHPDTADVVAAQRSLLDETVGLQRLVDDLLLLARTSEGASPPRREAVDLAEVVRAEARRTAGPDVTVGVSGRPPCVLGDPAQLRRAVRNLLDNAARHARTSISVSLDGTADPVVLTVDDDGPGVPPAERARIFERFTRVDEGRATRDGGAGLGLAITTAIVERHGGAVAVGDAPTGGARFTVTLPAAAGATAGGSARRRTTPTPDRR